MPGSPACIESREKTHMKNTNRMSNRIACGIVVVGILFIAGAVGAQGNEYKYKKFGESWKDCEKITYRSSGDMIYVMIRNNPVPIPRKDIEGLRIPKPADFDKYAREVRSGSASPEAIRGLENIAFQYKMLVWDVQAYLLLFPAYLKDNNTANIKKICDDYERVTSTVPDALQGYFWKALLEARQYARLKRALTDAIENGSRPVAAMAHLVRGDLYVDEGKKTDALIEGYFRVIILFKDVKGVQAEALFKAWRTLKSMSDPRANKFLQRLVDEFPESPYSRESRKG